MLLEKALTSVLEQRFEDFEIIIVDDCSSDETANFLSQYKAKDSITVLRNTQNLGLQRSLNFALTHAKADIIARIDDDDIWTDKDKLAKQYLFMLNNPEVVLMGTAYDTDEGTITNPEEDTDIRKQILFRCPFQHSTVVFRRIVDNKPVIYDGNLNYAEDWELWLRLGQYGKLYNMNESTTYIRTGENLSEQYFVKQHVQNLSIIRKFRSVYPKSGSAILYHRFVILFFRLFPANGSIHRIFQKVFKTVFKT